MILYTHQFNSVRDFIIENPYMDGDTEGLNKQVDSNLLRGIFQNNCVSTRTLTDRHGALTH